MHAKRSRADRTSRQETRFQGRFVVGEDLAVPGVLSHRGVERFDGVGGAGDLADLGRETGNM